MLLRKYSLIIFTLLAVVFSAGMSRAAEPVDYTLDNGLKVILIENHRAPVVSMLVWVKAGSTAERPDEYGLAHLIEHMLFKGTAKRGPGQVAAEVEAAGGDINAYTSYDETVYYIDMASRFAGKGLDILADMVFTPTFDPGEFAREKEVVLEEVRMGEDDPSRELSRALFDTAYQTHPYGRPVIGYSKSIQGFTRDLAADYHKRWYRPDNMVLVVAGDFKPDQVKPMIAELFGRSSDGLVPTMNLPEESAPKGMRIKILRSDVKTVQMALAFPIPAFDSEDIESLDLLSAVLGRGRTSRLYQTVKRDLGLVNGVSAWSYTPQDPGLFGVNAMLTPKDLLPAVKAIMSEIAELGQSGVRPEELDRARLNMESDFIYSRETMSGEARTVANFEALAGDFRYKDEYLAALEKVTPADLKSAAAEYLKPDRLTLVVQLPEKALPDLTDAQIRQAVEQGAQAVLQDKVVKYKLSNGATLLVKADPSLPLVAVRAAFLGGVRFEDKKTNGLNNLMAEIWDRGTKQKSSEELAEAVENIAGEVSSFSGRNSFGVTAEFLSRYLDQGLALFAEVLTQPNFTPEEVEKARPNILSAIKRKQDQMTARVFRLFNATIYQGHPYSMDELGVPETVAALTAKDVQDYYDTWARPENAVISVVGDVDPELIKARLEELLKGWDGKAPSFTPPQAPTPWQGLKTAQDDVDRAQAHLVLGFPAPGLDQPDRYALEVLDSVLSGMGGRLFIKLRDRQSLAYSLSSFYSPGLDVGSFGFYIAFEPSKYDQVKTGLEEIINELKTKPVTDQELTGAKEYILGGYEIGLQKYSSQAANYAFNELYGLGYEYQDRFVAGINAVTAEQVMQAAKKYLNMDQGVEVLVGPIEKTKG